MTSKITIDDTEVEIIEEKDDSNLEEQLKFKISWNPLLKVVYMALILGVVIYYIIKGGFPSDLYIYLIMFAFIIGGAVLISWESDEENCDKTISGLVCMKCTFKQMKSFEDGDFIFKMKGKCPNCAGNLQIAEIYSVKLAKKMKEEKKEEKKKEKKEL